MKDPKRLFNARLDSKTVRALDVHENEHVDEAALEGLVKEAVKFDASKVRKR